MLTYTLASVSHSWQILRALADLGVSMAPSKAIGMVLGDWLGLYLYAVVIAIGMLIGLAFMRLVSRWFGLPEVMVYAIGGGLALLCIQISMQWLLSIAPIAGARGVVGISLQCLAGVAGGALFGYSRASRST